MQIIEPYLSDGWFISEATVLLAGGSNDENSGYILTLADPSGRFMREAFVPRAADVDEMLKQQRVPMAR